MATQDYPSCEQRIEQAMTNRMADIKAMLDAYPDYAKDDQGYEIGNFEEFGLEFNYVEGHTDYNDGEAYWRFLISTGGPSEEIRFYATSSPQGWRLHTAEFWFLDWFDGAGRTLSADQFHTARRVWDWFKDAGSVQAAYEKAMGL